MFWMEKQNGVCAICKNPEPCRDKGKDYLRSLATDHCHKTGKVRGLLCTQCNTAIGAFRDNINVLKEAIKYLKKHE